MSPREKIDGIYYYHNDDLGIEPTPVPSSYIFHDEATPVQEHLTWEEKEGFLIGEDTFLEGHQVILWEDGSIGTVHESHLT